MRSIAKGESTIIPNCGLYYPVQRSQTKALRKERRCLLRATTHHQKKIDFVLCGESKMRNALCRRIGEQQENLHYSRSSLDNNRESVGVSASIDLVTPQWVSFNNDTSVTGVGASPVTSSCASSTLRHHATDNKGEGGKKTQRLRNHREDCGSQGQHNSQQSKSLVLTHNRMKRRGSLLSNFSSSSLLLGLMLIITSLIHSSHEQSFFSPTSEEWDGGSFRSGTYGNGYTCVNIPVNFTLCKNIGYTKMMTPNLLGHDSLQEAEFHAKSWVPLVMLKCHPDTQLFLCSLFSPICLDRPIYPCRSLCQGVQEKCEPRMLAYNYPWPSMLKCDQFPEDHDLCIRPGAANKSDGADPELECPSCNQAHTCENIVDNFCRAEFVFRAKYKRSKGTVVEFRKERWFKPREGNRRGREFRTLILDSHDDCCATKLRPGFPYIVMGIKRGDEYVITFAMQWNGKDKILKNAVRTFRSMDCTNPLPMSVTAAGGKNGTANANAGRRRRRKQGRRRERQQYGGCRVSAPGKN